MARSRQRRRWFVSGRLIVMGFLASVAFAALLVGYYLTSGGEKRDERKEVAAEKSQEKKGAPGESRPKALAPAEEEEFTRFTAEELREVKLLVLGIFGTAFAGAMLFFLLWALLHERTLWTKSSRAAPPAGKNSSGKPAAEKEAGSSDAPRKKSPRAHDDGSERWELGWDFLDRHDDDRDGPEDGDRRPDSF